MSGQGGARRRRSWRRAVCAWAVAVAVGSGLTLWLQDSVRPQEPYGSTPRPLDTSGVDDVGCPPSPDPEPVQGAGRTAVACLYVTTRR
ncbi:hypothetical protein ACFWIO_23390 [Streptomyces diastatochromogenes]|uniref:hypothetical protein n=1 Tax=Streptomyces diastatochromogenes TaxID=42236 RepID=UPI003647D3CC